MNAEYAHLQAQMFKWAEDNLTSAQRVGVTERDLRRLFYRAGAPGLNRIRRRSLRVAPKAERNL